MRPSKNWVPFLPRTRRNKSSVGFNMRKKNRKGKSSEQEVSKQRKRIMGEKMNLLICEMIQ